MATYRRISDNDAVTPDGTTSGLSMNDIVLMQKQANGTDDKKVTLGSVQSIPLVAATLSGTAFSTICANYANLIITLGMKLSVTFDSAYTGSTTPTISFSDGTNTRSLKIKAHGTEVGSGFNKAGESFTGVIRTSSTNLADSTAWYLDLDSDIVKSDSNSVTYCNGSVVPTNNILVNLDKNSFAHRYLGTFYDGSNAFYLKIHLNSGTTGSTPDGTLVINGRGKDMWFLHLSAYSSYSDKACSITEIENEYTSILGVKYDCDADNGLNVYVNVRFTRRVSISVLNTYNCSSLAITDLGQDSTDYDNAQYTVM